MMLVVVVGGLKNVELYLTPLSLRMAELLVKVLMHDVCSGGWWFKECRIMTIIIEVDLTVKSWERLW